MNAITQGAIGAGLCAVAFAAGIFVGTNVAHRNVDASRSPDIRVVMPDSPSIVALPRLLPWNMRQVRPPRTLPIHASIASIASVRRTVGDSRVRLGPQHRNSCHRPPISSAVLIADRPEALLWIGSLRTRNRSVDTWALERVETLLAHSRSRRGLYGNSMGIKANLIAKVAGAVVGKHVARDSIVVQLN